MLNLPLAFSVEATSSKEGTPRDSRKIMTTAHCGAAALLLIVCLAGATPYSKYGRSCKDIGCLSNEVCIMAEDPCTLYSQNQCGRYPTCKKMSQAGALSCTTMICPSGQYCKTEDGKPTCVNQVPNSVYDLFAEYVDVENRILRKRQSEPEGIVVTGTLETSKKSDYPAGSGYPSSGSSSSGYPKSSGYPAGGSSSSGYPKSSGYPAGSGYPSSSRSSSGYPGSGSSGYPGYPSTEASAKKASASSVNSGYPGSGSSGYPGSGSSGYPGSGSSGYPGSKSSGYPGSGSSGYPSSGSSGYPGYPSNEPAMSRSSASRTNAGYPSQGQPAPGNYPNQYGYQGYQNPGYGQYPGNYPPPPQGGYPPAGGYYNPNYPGYQNPNVPPPTKKPSISDQLTSFARNLAQQVITQTVLDRVTGKSKN
ncbi:prisilkin-39 [Orussus abietinus]|uniref:prisilkin-39 n=1 Tax=Orussus abietinus TaxID=222816 RepID=UPI000625DBA5|nr:prisilkin-39 [Orussus abietinus]